MEIMNSYNLVSNSTFAVPLAFGARASGRGEHGLSRADGTSCSNIASGSKFEEDTPPPPSPAWGVPLLAHSPLVS